MSRTFTWDIDKELGDFFLDLCQTKRWLRILTTKTYADTGTYLFKKLFKKRSDGEIYIDQRVLLTKAEFHELIINAENINIRLSDDGKRQHILKRTESPITNKLT